jgi:hypothetical protein
MLSALPVGPWGERLGDTPRLPQGDLKSTPLRPVHHPGAEDSRLTQALAGELPLIRVNTVSPGLEDVRIYAGLPEAQRTALFAVLAACVPVKRVGRPEDKAQPVLYLINNSFTTGSIVSEDGG